MGDRETVKRELDAAIGHGLGVCAVDTSFSSRWAEGGGPGHVLRVQVEVLEELDEAVARVGVVPRTERMVLLDRIVALVQEAKMGTEEAAGVVGQALMRVLDLAGEEGERARVGADGVVLVWDTRGRVLRRPTMGDLDSGVVGRWEIALRAESETTTRWMETVVGTTTRIEWGAVVRTTDAARAITALLGEVAV